MRGAGGTPGGIWQFLLGAAMAIAGIWFFFDAIYVGSFHGGVFGRAMGGFGGSIAVVFIPLVLGIVLVFANGKSKLAWGLIVVGLICIAVEVISGIRFQFHMKLWHVLILLVCVFGGLGLIARSLRNIEAD